MVPSLVYETNLNIAFPFDTYVQGIGLAVWAVGGLLVVWSGRVLGRFMVVQIAVATDHRLVQEGPYGRIRHPTYAGAMAIAIGEALLFLSLPLAAIAVLIVIIANYRARKEERLLASPAGFGEAYGAYVMRTGRFLPRLRT